MKKFLQMIDKAEELIEVMIIDEFAQLVNEQHLRRLIDLLRTQTEKFSDYITELAEFDRQELQIKYAQKLDEYWTGDGDDLNFERVQVRIPKIIELYLMN